LRLNIGTRRSPIETGVNDDPRPLGIFVEEISVDPPVRDLAVQALDLTSCGVDREALWHGWSDPESHGCWTYGPVSRLRWRAGAAIAARSRLLVEVATLAPRRDELRGLFRLNELATGSFCFTPAARFDVVLTLPIREEIAAGREVEFSVEVDNPRSPAAATGSEDLRPLGLAIRRIWIDQGQ
jgi:hypothetical protein